jgi:hypothetical protein
LIGALSGASVGNSFDAEYDAKWNAYEQKYEKEREDQQAREKQYQSDYQSKQKSDDDAYKKEYARRRYGEGYDHEGFRVMPDEFMNLYNPQQHGDAKYVSKIWESLRRSGLVNHPERVKAVESFMKAYGTPNADPNVLKGYVDALGGGTSNEGTLLRMLWEKKYGNPGSSQQKLSFYKAAELFGSLLANEELALPIVGALYGGGLGAYAGYQRAKQVNNSVDYRLAKGKLTEEQAKRKKIYPWDNAIKGGLTGGILGGSLGGVGALLASADLV